MYGMLTHLKVNMRYVCKTSRFCRYVVKIRRLTKKEIVENTFQ